MPELPEVETIVRQLNKEIRGLKVKKVWFDWPKLFKGKTGPQKFKKIIKNKKILGIRREGKNILIDLNDGLTCLIHLKLTGRILVGDSEFIQKDSYVHFRIELSNKKILALSDLRKFAKIILEKTEEVKTLKEIKELGPNPLASNFTLEIFNEFLNRKKNGRIKEVLMNQNIISGIGNIYANEILWEAKVNPFKDVKALTFKERREIYKAIKKILPLAVKYSGSTIADEMYEDTRGKPGKYGKMLRVYQREKEKCFRCNAEIKRIVQKGRSTFYCPQCQK